MWPNTQIQKQSAWNKLIIAIPSNPVIILKTIFTNVDRERCLYFADLVTFTEEILNGKLHFMCSIYIGELYERDIFLGSEIKLFYS